MTIGVDVDQFYTFPEIAPSLLTSASKRMDIAVGAAVWDYSQGNLVGGRSLSTVANGGVELAPYHNWQDRIPEQCKKAVEDATEGLSQGNIETG